MGARTTEFAGARERGLGSWGGEVVVAGPKSGGGGWVVERWRRAPAEERPPPRARDFPAETSNPTAPKPKPALWRRFALLEEVAPRQLDRLLRTHEARRRVPQISPAQDLSVFS